MVTQKGLDKDPDLGKKIDKAIFPGFLGGLGVFVGRRRDGLAVLGVERGVVVVLGDAVTSAWRSAQTAG